MNFKFTSLIKNVSIFIILFCSTATTFSGGFSITHYDIQTTLSTLHDDYIFVQLTCDMVKSDTGLSYVLLFSSGAKVNSIQYQDSLSVNISYHFKGTDTMLIVLPPQAKYRNSITLQFNYAFPISMTDSSILMMDRGHRWYPLIADCIAGVKLTADVPEGCEVLSTGDMISKTSKNGMSTFIWESSMPVFKVPLIIFKADLYKQTSTKADDKEIVLYTLAQYDTDNGALLNEAGSVFKFCTENFGHWYFWNIPSSRE
jgi:hypothetical protein